MNKKFLFLLVGFVITLVATEKIADESFIVPPKPRKESRNHILEDIGSLLMVSAKESAQDIQSSALVQELFVEDGRQLLTQEKNCIFATADSTQLHEYRALIKELSYARDRWNKAKQQIMAKRQKIVAPKPATKK